MSKSTITRHRRLATVLLACAVPVLAFSAGSAAVIHGQRVNEPHAVFEAPANSRSFADVVDQVSPAVVNIKVTKTAQAMPTNAFGSFGGGDSTPFDEFFRHFFGGPGFPQQGMPMRAQGSGFIIDEGGYVVTNNHVIDGADKIVVATQDGKEFSATLVGTDPKTDVALLKVDAKGHLPSLRFGDSDQARVGEWVLAIGNPFGLGGTATAGIISARGRDIQSGPYDDFLQIDAPINSGNSGGPVFNADGDVIGMNTAIYSPNGGNVGIGFAIPSKQVIAVVDSLKETGTVRRGWLGVQIQDVDDDIASSFSLHDVHGALVGDVVKDSPADKGGLQVGDIILKFNDQNVEDAHDLGRIVAAAEPQGRVPIEVWRGGNEKTLHVKLGESAEETSMAGAPGASAAAGHELGIAMANLTDETRAQLRLPDDYAGVVVTGVAPDSSAAEEGLRRGDAISRVDSEPVSNIGDAQRALEHAREHGNHVTLLVRRGDAQQFVSLSFS